MNNSNQKQAIAIGISLNGNYLFNVIIRKDEEGYIAECLDLKGVYTQAKTEEEAEERIREAIECVLDSIKEKDLSSEEQFITRMKCFLDSFLNRGN